MTATATERAELPKRSLQQQFFAMRRAALLTMDAAPIWAFARYYGLRPPHAPAAFWEWAHRQRAAALDLPIEARDDSKRWLRECGVDLWEADL
jgi:hypothetical protein